MYFDCWFKIIFCRLHGSCFVVELNWNCFCRWSLACFELFRYKCEDSRWFHENVSKMTAHFNWRNETEALLRFCVSEFFVRKALYLNTNLILLVKWPRIRPMFGGHYSLAFRCFFFLCICRFATFHREVKYRRYHVFLFYKLTKFERGSQQTPYYKILFEAIFGKAFCAFCVLPALLELETVASKVLFPRIIRQFSRPLYGYEG